MTFCDRHLATKWKAPLSWAPCTGSTYRVEGHYLGEFIGECERVDKDVAWVRILDPMRPMPKVRNRCPFPACVLEEFHQHDHEFAPVHPGALLDLFWRSAKWIPLEGSRETAA